MMMRRDPGDETAIFKESTRRRTVFATSLVLVTLLSGCFFTAPADSGMPLALPPPVLSDDAYDHPGPSGTWTTSTQVAGWTAWVARFDEKPPERFEWSLHWEPTTEGGFLVTSGFLFGTLYANQWFAFTHEALAYPSVALDHVGLANVRDPRPGPWFLAFIAQPFDAEGVLELTMDWGDGPTRSWNPLVHNETGTESILEFTVESGTPLDLDLAMDTYQGIHLLLPCTRADPRPDATLVVQLGDDGANAFRSDGRREDGNPRTWATYAGRWTYPLTSATTYVAYDGPKSIDVSVLRSSVDTAQLLSREIGHGVTIDSASYVCLKTGPSLFR